MARRKQLRGHRKSGSRGYQRRSTGKRALGERFLIVCEGEKTEPNYFNKYRVPGLIHVRAVGFGVSPSQLVDIAFELRRESSGNRDQDKYDQVWCVFDKDDCNESDFNNAIMRAEKLELKVAYSNQTFELWYLLHFHFYNSPMHRKDYEKKLSELLDSPYRKNRTDMYDRLRSQQKIAIRYSKRLLGHYPNRRPALDNPSTTVHLLVEELNRFLPENRSTKE